MALSEKGKKDEFVKHSEVKQYEKKVKVRVKGSAKHEDRFSINTPIMEDNNKIFDVLTRLSDHVSDLEKRVAVLEGPGKEEPPKK